MMKLVHWNSQNIRAALLKLPNMKSISINPPGGDVDTESLCISIAQSRDTLFVAGFTTNGDITDPTDCEVSQVEVTDGLDSCGGLTSSNRNTALVYAEVVTELRRMNFDVVPCMKDYF
jgi:hypothetical protein